MGLLDAIKDKFGGGDEPAPPENKLRQPPGRDGPAGPEPPEPPGDRAPVQGAGPGEPPAPGGGPEERRGPPGPGPGGEGPRERGPPERGSPRGERGAPGSTLDTDRGGGRERGPPGGAADDLDFEPPGGGERGPGPEPAGASRPPRPGDDQGPRREQPSRRGQRGRGPGPDEGADDLPESPRDYNLDLPAREEEGDRLQRIEDQNDRIIGLLQDIRDNMGGERRRR